MNIGIVTTWEERGASYVSRHYFDLLTQKFNVFIYARGGSGVRGDSSLFDEAKCYRSKASTRIYSTYMNKREFLSWIKNNSIDIVFFNEQHWWPPIVWCDEIGVRTGAYIDYYTEKTIPYFALFDFIICNTKKHFSAFSWHPNSYLIPWGTSVELFRPSLERDDKGVTFFHSSGMSPHRKGTDLVVRAFCEIQSDNAKLIVHAQCDIDGFLKDSLGITKSDLPENLEFIEKTVSAPGLYHMGDVYVYPSRLDGLGLTVAEALSCGLPVIVPDDAPMNEFVSQGRGKVVPVGRYYARSDGYYWPMNSVDVEALGSCMSYYLENPSIVPLESANARTYALKNLDWEQRFGDVVKVFERCIDEPKVKNHTLLDEIRDSHRSLSSRARLLATKIDSIKNRLLFL